MKRKLVYLTLFVTIMLSGCAKQAVRNDTPMPSQDNTVVHGAEDALPKPTGITPSGTEKTDTMEKEIVSPTKEAVLAAREQALEGMTEEHIEDLTSFIIRANHWLEHRYKYSNFFELLSDTNNLMWTYFHQTGEIQTGWSYDMDMANVCESECLTENEFYEKYGTPVLAYNTYDVDGFVAEIDSLILNVKSESLIADLQYIVDEALLAKNTHDVDHVVNIYQMLHDMDYFLLRYGSTDVNLTVPKYYGMLSNLM